MFATADSKRKRRAAFAALAALILLAGAAPAQAMDAVDRQDKLDINREGAATRIERLHADQRGRQQEKPDLKTPRKTPKKPQRWLQY
jgi:uncharacterized protein YPO0396